MVTNMKLSEFYRKRLEMYLAAEEAILCGAQSYAVGSRNLTRANLAEIRDAIDDLYKRLAGAEAMEGGKGQGANKVSGVIARDG